MLIIAFAGCWRLPYAACRFRHADYACRLMPPLCRLRRFSMLLFAAVIAAALLPLHAAMLLMLFFFHCCRHHTPVVTSLTCFAYAAAIAAMLMLRRFRCRYFRHADYAMPLVAARLPRRHAEERHALRLDAGMP